MTELDAERWRRFEELFVAASELAPGERDAFLAEACAGDGELRKEVEALIAADEGSEARLERAVRGTLELAAGEEQPRPVIERAGPYRILREIGRGGMGTVYLAERDDEHYRQRVGVKVVRRGPDSGELRRRLRQERQILANLDHPHIARLLDGGNTEDGAPYIVAEYVEGEPIDRYCDRNARASPPASSSSPRSAPRCSTPTATWSSTATSSRRTCWSPLRARPSCSTSVSPSCSIRRRRRPPPPPSA